MATHMHNRGENGTSLGALPFTDCKVPFAHACPDRVFSEVKLVGQMQLHLDVYDNLNSGSRLDGRMSAFQRN
jgi:hypothetical protein